MIKKIFLSILLFAVGLAAGLVVFANPGTVTKTLRERFSPYELVAISRIVPFDLIEVSDYEIRVHDLMQVKEALDEFHQANGTYPVSKGWDGYNSTQGYGGKDWIPALVPKFMGKMPRDPRMHGVPHQQYLYKSDGTDYKLIACEPGDCESIRALKPEMVDPNPLRLSPDSKTCNAYGFWTPGAAGW